MVWNRDDYVAAILVLIILAVAGVVVYSLLGGTPRITTVYPFR